MSGYDPEEEAYRRDEARDEDRDGPLVCQWCGDTQDTVAGDACRNPAGHGWVTEIPDPTSAGRGRAMTAHGALSDHTGFREYCLPCRIADGRYSLADLADMTTYNRLERTWLRGGAS